MGFMETAVVVYLRKIYYPEGFQFPLVTLDKSILLTELFREAATLIMLLGAGIFTGRNRLEKFGFFIYSFAVWDISYYIFLKTLLGWPASLLTWDVLFLIPVTWVGPVLGPVINSFTMILLALTITWFLDKKDSIAIKSIEWLLLIFGSITVIISYTLDYSRYMINAFGFSSLFQNGKEGEVMAYAAKYIPVNFNWWIFILGETLILSAIALFYNRESKDGY
ncbi:MAG: hypothetical protein DRJ05_18395 [Bacteroidetes bacterium]|nr:MAG: hypothetical protein DRJ05_18395 [Bacteroidota bacterium]